MDMRETPICKDILYVKPMEICLKIKQAANPAACYAPRGIRIPVLALRGPRPGPLDDGGWKHADFIMPGNQRQCRGFLPF